MSFRVSALVAVAAVLALSSVAPLLARPQPPVPARQVQFQTLLHPGASPVVAPDQRFLDQNGPLKPEVLAGERSLR